MSNSLFQALHTMTMAGDLYTKNLLTDEEYNTLKQVTLGEYLTKPLTSSTSVFYKAIDPAVKTTTGTLPTIIGFDPATKYVTFEQNPKVRVSSGGKLQPTDEPYKVALLTKFQTAEKALFDAFDRLVEAVKKYRESK